MGRPHDDWRIEEQRGDGFFMLTVVNEGRHNGELISYGLIG